MALVLASRPGTSIISLSETRLIPMCWSTPLTFIDTAGILDQAVVDGHRVDTTF